MANRFFNRIMHGPSNQSAAPLGGNRAQAMQRLQIGLSGIVALVLIVGLADTLRERADQSAAETVPEAAATIEPTPTETPQSDPLAEAGVVPDLPADTAEAAAQNAPVLPEQGNAKPVPKPE